MRKVLQLTIILFLSLSFANFSQAQSCVPTNLNGTVIQLSCGNPCTAIRLQVPHLKSSEQYAVNSIAYNPYPYVTTSPALTLACSNQDDKFFASTQMPFTFCFWDSSYNKFAVGTNGLISFDNSDSLNCNHWELDDPEATPLSVPFTGTGSQCSQGTCATPIGVRYPRASIMGIYQDIDITKTSSPNRKMEIRFEGTAPCRRAIISFNEIPNFSTSCDDATGFATTQIVIFENTGLIEVYVRNKPLPSSCAWNNGHAILGILNWDRNEGLAAPGRDLGSWQASNEAWRFTPNGSTSRYISSELLDMSGTVLVTADTLTTVPGLLDINFLNVCPGPGTTQYVVRTTFESCPTGTNMISLDTVTIQRNNTLPVTTTLVQPTCGLNSGSITVNVATGVGTTPYAFSLNGGLPQLSNVFSGLGAGTYTVYATDATGCDTTYQVTLNAISNLTATTTFTNSSCPGASSGTMTVVPTSGVGPYTFLLNPGAVSNTTGVFTGLGPGTYTVTYTDVNTCNGVATATIGAGTPITASQTSTATSCAGATNGSITVTPTSGTAPYTFALDGGSPQASGSFPGVSSGAHTVLVKDANGCTVSVAVTVGTGTGLSGAIFQTPLSCPGANDGTVTLNPTTGVAPYTYSIDGGAFQSSNVFTGLAAGNHTVVFRDANNCQGSRTIAVGGGTAPTTTATSANTSCAGASNGVIVINPIAGSTYTINPGAISNTTGTFTGLAAGTYTLSIATAGGCAGVVTPSTVTINPGAALSTTATTSATCTGGNSGTITVASPAAGTTYTLNPGAISNTTGSFTGLAAGTYTISFLTPAGCTGTVSPNPVVTANPSLVAAAVSVPATCPGINNGSITVTAPTAGTTYTLNPGAVSNSTGVFTSLAPGNYTISFVATGGCTGAVSPAPVVAVGPAPTTTASSTATSCPGVADGTVTVTPVGAGTTYTINPGAISNTSGIFNNLAAGTYTVTFVTGAGCSGTVPVNPIVAAGPAVTGTATATNTSCPTVNNGTITVNSPTGAGTTYTLSPGGISNTTGIFTGLAPNTYTISFQTSAGCTGTISPNPIVAAGPALTSSFTQVNPVCANINDGVITIIPQTGTAAPYTATLTGPGGPYTYSGAGPISFANLAPGTYTYTYGENGGCNGTGGPVTLVTNAPIFTPAQLTNLSCNNSANGTVSFTPLGGVAPYQYSSNAGGTYQAANSFSGLTAGPHTFRIKDNVGCTKDTTITLTQPAVLTATTSGTTPAGCSNNDGTMSAAGAGGTAPYSYTIAGTAVNTSGASTGVFTGLPNGPYTITVTDAQGCTRTTTGTVGLTDNMFLTLGPDVTICAERSVTFNPQTNPETNVFTWRGINGAPTSTIANPSIKNAVATPLDTATYELHAQWGGCERRDTIVVNILRKPIANAGKDTAICNLTYAVLRGSSSNLSGTVNYAWSPAANVEFPNQAVTRVYPPGSNTTYTYTLTVTDNYGCNFSVTDQIDVRVQPPVPAFAGNDTTAVKGVAHQLTASGGDDYLWTPSAPLNNAAIANPLATLQNDQKFVVRVTDFAGCIGYDTVFVKVYDGPAYYIPNAFTPNGDGLNDVFRPVPAGIARTEYFRIFNRYGETIFESNQFMKGWDGTFKGKKQAIGAYVWIIKGIDRNGKNVELKGTVMLLQ